MATKSSKNEIARRFRECGERLFGNNRGWKKKYADKLDLSPQQLSAIIAGRDSIGGKIQARLRSIGANVDYIMTGVIDQPRAASCPIAKDPESQKILEDFLHWMEEQPSGDWERIFCVVRIVFSISENKTDFKTVDWNMLSPINKSLSTGSDHQPTDSPHP